MTEYHDGICDPHRTMKKCYGRDIMLRWNGSLYVSVFGRIVTRAMIETNPHSIFYTVKLLALAGV